LHGENFMISISSFHQQLFWRCNLGDSPGWQMDYLERMIQAWKNFYCGKKGGCTCGEVNEDDN